MCVLHVRMIPIRIFLSLLWFVVFCFVLYSIGCLLFLLFLLLSILPMFFFVSYYRFALFAQMSFVRIWLFMCFTLHCYGIEISLCLDEIFQFEWEIMNFTLWTCLPFILITNLRIFSKHKRR